MICEEWKKRRIQLIYDYLNNKPSASITKLMKKYGKEEIIFDPHMSEEDKLSIIECFFDNLEMEYVREEKKLVDELSENNEYAYAYERIMDNIEYYKAVNKSKKMELRQ